MKAKDQISAAKISSTLARYLNGAPESDAVRTVEEIDQHIRSSALNKRDQAWNKAAKTIQMNAKNRSDQDFRRRLDALASTASLAAHRASARPRARVLHGPTLTMMIAVNISIISMTIQPGFNDPLSLISTVAAALHCIGAFIFIVHQNESNSRDATRAAWWKIVTDTCDRERERIYRFHEDLDRFGSGKTQARRLSIELRLP